ncbi:RNA exonuclease Rex3 [Sporothrix schenckii 1099-18]|uniref:Exonuclease domain-containing protein n=2 Tax=Sporothrix schenckii TaxID=29908 RepID=U7Q413_SPOS1|nr:RNA exonuclease Rex3 [Sporothrix schenckii 1099-18]ERT01775.1 hypothetical protein HMPREF1624_00069 [Sporothrix schenckii ATCC 58251]KJR81095.1 RNA exonuclease Rex3 [Sporothrix schenckii 1099-18]
MDIPDGLLSHIPCPNGDGCKTVRCLFGHAGSQPIGAPTAGLDGASTAVTSAAASTGKHRSSFSDESSLAEKRPKIEHMEKTVNDKRSTSSSLSKSSSSSWTQRSSKGSSESSTNSLFSVSPVVSHDADPSLSALKRPISPPPLKRRQSQVASVADTPSPAAVTATATAGQAPTSVTAAKPSQSVPLAPSNNTTSSKPVPPAQEKRKPETLNPRYVAKAPAKHEIRLRLVKLLHQEFSRLNKLLHASAEHPEDRKHYLLSPQGLIWAALDVEEHYATTKSSTIYSDTIKHRIMEFKRMTVVQWVKERKETKEAARRARQAAGVSTPAAAPAACAKTPHTTEPAAATTGTSATSPPPPIVTGLPPDQELVLLQRHFVTPTDKLGNQGYVPSVPSDEDIQKARDAEDVSKGWEQCERCTRRFQVFPGRREDDGALTSGGKCQYHPGRLNRATQVFSCCSASASDGSPGCETAASHVFKANDAKRLALLWNFVETPANPDPNVPVDQAVCFDCEMAYTVYGMEVVRLTATSWPSGELLLDILVRPYGAIIDFNSRFSGVWPEDFAASIPYTPTAAADAATKRGAANPKGTDETSTNRPPMLMASSPEAARTLFHEIIRPETVLIGHALENDLKAMRMVHPRISDTVLLFPHPKGLPIRYSLRVLAKEHLDRVVQAGGHLTGHDSAEDARVAGDLVRFKIKSKWDDLRRRQNWKLVDGVMVQDS